MIDTAHRRHQRIRYIDETVLLPGYDSRMRQVAVAGLGREQPTLFLSNNVRESARLLIVRYAGRNRVEDALGISINFFHLDCLASEVRLNVDLDAPLTVLANSCYRWLAKQLRGFDAAATKQLYRKFVETSGIIEIEQERIVVRFDKRCPNPILRICCGSPKVQHEVASITMKSADADLHLLFYQQFPTGTRWIGNDPV